MIRREVAPVPELESNEDEKGPAQSGQDDDQGMRLIFVYTLTTFCLRFDYTLSTL